MSMSRRFALAYVLLAIAAVGAGLALVHELRSPGQADAVPCTERLPAGQGADAIVSTTALWVADVVMRRQPSCGYTLASRRLRARLARREWAAGKSPVQVFATRYPVVAYAEARSDSARTQAVYAVSRRLHDLVRIGADGTYEAHMAAGLAAPDGGLAGYDLVLRLEDGSWRVDRCWRVRV